MPNLKFPAGFPLALAFFSVFLVFGPVRAQELGATLNKSGNSTTSVTFRVWAPNASAVRVAGDFNSWNATANALTKNSTTNVWSGTINAARTGHAYKYVITAGNGTQLWRKDPRARLVRTMSDGSQAAVIYDTAAFVWEDGDYEPPFPNEIVMYELHVGSFYDPTPNDGQPATLYDAALKLDYLRDLGVNMIALMPVSEFNGRHSWGYNPTALFAIEETYGGPDALKFFVNEAHKKGMAVQVDVVHNHYGDLADSGASDLENFDGGEPYFYNASDETARPGISRTKWGPRPRYSDPNVRQFISDNIRMYLDEYKIWALRWDSPRNITGYDSSPGAQIGDPDTEIPEAVTMMQQINASIHSRNPRYYSIAEDANSPGGYSGHWEISFHNVVFPRLLPLTQNGTLPAPFVGRLEFPTLNTRNGTNIGYRLETKEPPGFRVIFSENHDKCGDHNSATDGARLASDFDPVNPESLAARRKTMLTTAITLTSAGTPMLWMGQEHLAKDEFKDAVPMDWLRAGRFEGMVRFHRDLVGLRRNLANKTRALTFTSLPEVDDLTDVTSILAANESEGWMAYERKTGNASESILVAVNFSASNRTVSVNATSAGPWRVFVNSDWKLYGSDLGGVGPVQGGNLTTSGVTNTLNFQVAPFSAVILGKAEPPALSSDANANGITDGWEMLFSAGNATADPDADGFNNLAEFQNQTDPTVPDRVSLPGVFNNWNIASRNMRWEPVRSVWRHVVRFTERGWFNCKAYKPGGWSAGNNGWAPGDDAWFEVPAAGTFEITYSPAGGNYSVVSHDADSNGNGMSDTWEGFYFYPATSANASANPDGDAFTNLQEFQRGSDPTEFDQPAMGVVGGYNGWNWNARNMRYEGHGVWMAAIPFTAAPSDRNYKFGVGPTNDNDNWGQPTLQLPTGYKSSTDFQWASNVSGWRIIRFNEKSSATSVEAPSTTDTDGDSMPDQWERSFGLDAYSAADASTDADGDDVLNRLEFARLSHPLVADRNPVMHMPGDGLWAENDSRTRMVWNRDLARWESVFLANPGLREFKFMAGTYGAGTWGWNGTGTPGVSIKWTNDNLKATLSEAGYYLARFEEISGNYTIAGMPTTDSDGDGMPDDWERFHSFNPAVNDASGDADGDQVLNGFEFARGSNPRLADRNSSMSLVYGPEWNPELQKFRMTWNSAVARWEGAFFGPRSGTLPFKFAAGSWGNGTWGWNGTGTVGASVKWANDDIIASWSGRVWNLVRFEEISGNYTIEPMPATDSNSNGMPDAWERVFEITSPTVDSDSDGVPNAGEFTRGGHPRFADHFASLNMVGDLNGWSFTNRPMTWNSRTLRWEWLERVAATTAEQKMKFVRVDNPNLPNLWENPNWGDNNTPFDNIAESGGSDFKYTVTQAPAYLFFSFDEITNEYFAGVMPATDSNSDGLADAWAGFHGVSGSTGNPDGDPFTNAQEFARGSDPNVADQYFRSHQELRVSGSFNGWSPATAPTMNLVGDNLWRLDLVISNSTAQEFKFVAGNTWNATNWGNGTGNAALPNLGVGNYRFEVNDVTRAFTVALVTNSFSDRYPGFSANQTIRGLSAKVEYLFGGTADQAPPVAHLPTFAPSGSNVRLSFVRRTDDSSLNHVVEFKSDLASGAWQAVSIQPSTEPADTDLQRWTYEIPTAGAPRGFYRIRAW
ncbi:MAG: alpha amylase C-terminal domain-containing protein [Verrucomicrobia bacterium]|nr:alpha amylase C-terminal domain-containing protein [Verrucomicrobiota bacterium]